MKRIFIAILLLAFVIAGCIYNFYAVGRAVADITGPLQQAEQAVENGDLSAALEQTKQAHATFSQRETALQCTVNERLLDTVRIAFVGAEAGAAAGDEAEFRTSLSALKQSLEDCSRAEQLTLGNLL